MTKIDHNSSKIKHSDACCIDLYILYYVLINVDINK